MLRIVKIGEADYPVSVDFSTMDRSAVGEFFWGRGENVSVFRMIHSNPQVDTEAALIFSSVNIIMVVGIVSLQPMFSWLR